MRLRDILSLAAHNLRESPLRTALCALSVAVGSGALLLILSIGLYGRKQVDVGLQTLGVSGLSVSRKADTRERYSRQHWRMR